MYPFFSIIIPVYNVAPYLRECLDSVLAQTFTDWEAICVDDGSTDGSGAILNEYAAKDSRFRVFHQPNSGVSAARNKGLDEARGVFVSFTDGDDAVSDEWLETAHKTIEQTGADIVRLWVTYWLDGTERPVAWANEIYSVYEGGTNVLAWGWRTLLREGWSWLLFLRRSNLVHAHGFFPEWLSMREDNIFLLRQIINFSKACQVGYVGYYYRQRISSAVSQYHTKAEARLFVREVRRLWRRDHSKISDELGVAHIKCMVDETCRSPFGTRHVSLITRAFRKIVKMCMPHRRTTYSPVCFVMPGPNDHPVGGYKVIYEYANRFAAAGWDVRIAYPLSFSAESVVRSFAKHPRSTFKCLWTNWKVAWHQRRHRKRGTFWFSVDPNVKWLFPVRIGTSFGKKLPEETRYVATYVTTARSLLTVRAAHKYYFIQGRENWYGVSLEELYETYRYPMKKIVISKWLQTYVREAGEHSVCIPNGLDFDYFKMATPIEQRNRFEVAMLWHKDVRKCTMDAVAALKLVKTKYPELHVTAFGVPYPPCDLPEWFSYVQRPSKEQHNRIYNKAAIFVASSEQEGWGLCPSEAMICGAAVACTDIGGYQSFAEDGVTALMSPAHDIQALAANVCRLMEDDELRVRIAKEGARNIQKFTWENSFSMMCKVFNGS